MMHRVNVKPMSVNEAWKGRRIKSDAYKGFEQELGYQLPNFKLEKCDKLMVVFRFGFSNIGADIDNPVKPVMDILQKKYKFNDSKVWRLAVEKVKVKKGEEFVEFLVTKIE